MEDRGGPRLPLAETWQGCDVSCPPGELSHYFGSYEPLTALDPEDVDAVDPIPSIGARDVDVWLTEWQVAEDGFDVVLDEEVDWELGVRNSAEVDGP